MNTGAASITRSDSEHIPFETFRDNTATLWISPAYTPRLDPRVLSTEDLIASTNEMSQHHIFDKQYLDQKRAAMILSRSKLAELERLLEASKSVWTGQPGARIMFERD
jgi:hypothetical protein